MNLDVVIVSYESAEHLPACLKCLPDDVRPVVVDNCSSDASAALAESWGAFVVRNASNIGFAAAANQGAALGKAELILFLNPDAHIDTANLQRLVSVLRSDMSAAVAGPTLIRPDGSHQRPWWPFPSAHHSWFEAVGLHRLTPHRERRYVPFVVGACFLVRRTTFEAFGGFDEGFWLYGEEADFCRRVAKTGWRVRYVAEAVAVHVGAASVAAAGGELAREHFLLGTDRFIAKHGGRTALVSHRVALLAGSAIRAGMLVGRPGDPVRIHRRVLVRRELRVLTTSPAAIPESPPNGRNHRDEVVVCSLEAWDDTWRRNQFLVQELMAVHPGLRVLFVEPAADVLHEMAHLHRFPRPIGLRQVDSYGRLWALRPRKLLPRMVGPWADRSLMTQVRAATNTLGITHPTLWVNDSAYAPLLKDTDWPALYDVTDDWLQATCSHREEHRRTQREQMVLARAAVVTACSPALVESRRGRRPVRLIPNAVDSAHFTIPQPRPVDLPTGICAVYIGTLHDERLDVELVIELARSLPSGDVVLVGPDAMGERSRSRLSAEPNVHLLGARPYGLIPGYLQHADVVIVPHLISTFTESLDPIKAYEILAVGRPAVVTPVAGLRELGPPSFCADRTNFVAKVHTLLADPPASLPRPAPSWSDRVQLFDASLRDARAAGSILSVVYVDHCAQLSGGEIALLHLLPALKKVSAHVILAEDGPFRRCLEEAGIKCEVLALPDRTRNVRRAQVVPFRLPVGTVVDTLLYAWRLRRRLRELQPDLLHSNSLKAGVYGCIAARLAGVPVIWHVRDRIDADYLPLLAVKMVRTLIWLLPNAVIANSRVTRGTLGPIANAHVVPSPVAYDGIPSSVRSCHGADASEYLFGMIGRISPWKGQDVFLRAFAKAFPFGGERAIIVGGALFGENEHEAMLHALATELGIADRVQFTGFRDDVAHVLSSLDTLVHASVIPEPFGQVIIEAMAAGVPVIAADAGGPVEIVGDHECGLLYPPGDIDALATLMHEVRGDESLRTRLSTNGYVRALDFTPGVVAAEIMEAYRMVLSKADGTRERKLQHLGVSKQGMKQIVRQIIGEPYVGKRLKLRSAARALDRLNLSPRRVLDAGCEDATFVYWLADRFPNAEIVGIDIDAEAIEACDQNRASRYRDRVSFRVSSFAELPESSFDLVTAFDVLEHITDDLNALRQLHRALRPGGRLLLHVPRNQWTDHTGAVAWISDEDAWAVNPGHVRAGYSPEHLRVLAESAGFQVNEVELWLRRWGALAHHIYARLEHPTPLRALTIPVTDVCAVMDRYRPAAEGNTVWLVATA